jgi:hypothetical protein
MWETWEWVLPDASCLSVRFDRIHRSGTIRRDDSVVSRFGSKSPFGGATFKLAPPPEPPEATVYRRAGAAPDAELSFDDAGGFVVRVADVIVPPKRKPDPQAPAPNETPVRPVQRPSPTRTLLAALACVGLQLLGSATVHRRGAESTHRHAPAATAKAARAPLDSSAVSHDGTIVAHYPPGFYAITVENPHALRVVRPELAEQVIVVSRPLAKSVDPAALHRELFAIAANIDGGNASSQPPPTMTVNATCNGMPGVASTMTVQTRPSTTAAPIRLQLTACTASREGRGYFVGYVVPVSLASTEASELRRIADATELRVPPSATTD